MPWLKVGDNAATYPPLMQVAGFPGADTRAVNETFGFLLRCAAQSAGHLTDYVVDLGTAQMIGLARTKKLIGWCVRASLLTPLELDGGVQVYVILNDPDFIHIRTKEEVEWDRQRKRDTSNTALTVQVRRRDGDNCRYCGIQVMWGGQKTNRSATYDHVHPGHAATVGTFVIACMGCNGSRQDSEEWAKDHPLRPIPKPPRYGKVTATFLSNNGYPTEPNLQPDAMASGTDHAEDRPRPAADHAATRQRPANDPAVARQRPGPPAAEETRPPPEWAGVDVAEGVPKLRSKLLDNSVTSSPVTGLAGSGREGEGVARRRRRKPRGRPPAPPAPKSEDPNASEEP